MTRAKFYSLIWLILININILYAVSGAIHFPLSHIDVWADWLYKAKVIYLHNFELNWLTVNQPNFAHPQYPILLPFFFALIYWLTGTSSELLPSLLSPIIYVLCLFICFNVLKWLKINTNQALLFTYLYSMLPPLMAQAGRYHAGMPDIYLTLCHWVGLYLIIKLPKQQIYIVVLTLIASSIKLEGILLASLLWIDIDYWKVKQLLTKKAIKSMGLTLVSSFALFAWQWWLKSNSVTSSYSWQTIGVVTAWQRWQTIGREILLEMFTNFNNWYFTWWLILPIIWLYSPNNSQIKYFKKVVFTASLFFFLIYTFSSVSAIGYVSSSFDRILLQLSPWWSIWFVVSWQNLNNQVDLTTRLKQR